MLFGKTKKMIEDKEAEIKLFLSNNYKDLAFQGYQEYVKMVNDLRSDGKIGDKDFEKISYKIEDYKKLFSKYKK